LSSVVEDIPLSGKKSRNSSYTAGEFETRPPGRPRIAPQLSRYNVYLDPRQAAQIELLHAQGWTKSAAARWMLDQQSPPREARQLPLWREAEQLPLALPELGVLPDAGDVFAAAEVAAAREHVEELVRLADALAALAATDAPADDQTAAPCEGEALWAAGETEPPDLGAEAQEPPERHGPRGEVRRGWRVQKPEPPPADDWIVEMAARILVLVRGTEGPQSPGAPPPGHSAPSWVPEPYRAEYERLRGIFPHADERELWKRVRRSLLVEVAQNRKPPRE
jgi:hypothetical protein